MEDVGYRPVDLKKVRTYPIAQRKSKVNVRDFADIERLRVSPGFIEGLPEILAGNDFREVVKAIVSAYRLGKPVILMMGAHNIKCGLSPIVIDLMKRRIVRAVAMNGAGGIHDFEIALIGETSEDVAQGIQDGSFGMAHETGHLMNLAIKEGLKREWGAGRSVGEKILSLNAPYRDYSILATAVKEGITATLHIAIGTDIIHQHPEADGAALGEGSFLDFRTFVSAVADLEGGGVIINIGSAVLLPEVFLKAITVARNLGHRVENFTAANFDMIRQYRPTVNVVERPTGKGGRGYNIIGHNEIMIPLLYAAILEDMREADV
ncbi:MAG: hypothetical protein ACUVXI_10915 [bacterium]